MVMSGKLVSSKFGFGVGFGAWIEIEHLHFVAATSLPGLVASSE